MSASARVVIIGSGIVGNSVAYHLAKMGWNDLLVIDKGPLHENHGSTSHAPGGVVPLSHSKIIAQLGIYSAQFYRDLEPFAGKPMVFTAGQLEVAISKERLQDLKRLKGSAAAFGAESFILSPQESVEKMPLLNPDAIVGSLFVPMGAIAKGALVSAALQRDASAMTSIRFSGDTPVVDFELKNGRMVAVLTSNPDLPRIECDYVVLCTNIWSPAMTEKFGVHLPLMAFEHQYMRTEPLAELAHIDTSDPYQEVTYPTTRELDSVMYYRQHHNSYGIGNYNHPAHMVRPSFLLEDLTRTAKHAFTPEDYYGKPSSLANTLIPALKDKKMVDSFNGMFAFPIDGYPMIGETSIGGFWTAVGSWLTHAPGVGKCLAEWMTNGDTEWDMRQTNVRRFHDFQTTDKYVSLVTKKNYREIYDVIHPRQPISEPRNVRLSPFDARHRALGASFTAFAGLELPNWYEANAGLVEKYKSQIPDRTGWEAIFWSPIQGAEHLETRNNVALFDLTGLSIIEVKGPGATQYVDYLCTNKTDTEIGKVVYTCMLTPKGGIKRDLAVTRLAEDTYWMFVGEGNLPLDRDWLEQNAPSDLNSPSVSVRDISNSYAALGLWGPNARKVLQKVTTADICPNCFPYFTAKWIDIGMNKALALRVSYAGELGWELHFPFDAALPIWDELWEAGKEFDMTAAGMGAFDSLRLEKGYRGWGTDIHTEYNPYEAGLGWTVKLKKGDFIGREACVEFKEKPLKKKFCAMTLEGGVALGYEAIYADGKCIGHTTSANNAYSLGTFLCYGYLPTQYSEPGTKLELEYLGRRQVATVVAEPLYDPKMEKLLG
jgi:dimethylglycine oxidase